MRLIELRGHELPKRPLMEMNVANLDELRTDFSTMFDHVVQARQLQVSAPLREFLIKRAVKAMQNDEQGNMVVRTPVHDLPDDAPAWLKGALAKGEVYLLQFKEGFETRLAHVIDWMASDRTAERVIRATPELNFLGHLAEKADQYFAEQQKGAEPEHADVETGIEVVMTFRTDPASNQLVDYQESVIADDKARGPVVAFWATLTSPEALNREGKLMSHCVGSYANLVQAADVVIYSLRDKDNQPHVTLELNQRTTPPSINQVKGKGNRAPAGKYAGYVRDFLNHRGIPPSRTGRSDLRGMGLLSYKGKFGTITDVGGLIQFTFKNGDTIRSLKDEVEPNSYYRSSQDKDNTVWYVEREGGIPLKLSLDSTDTEVHGLDVLRKEVSRYPTYQSNLIQYLTNHKMSASTDTLQDIGVFYDEMKKKWGTKDDLLEVILTHKGINVSRLGAKLYLSQGATIFANMELDLSGGSSSKIVGIDKFKIVNDIPAVGMVPEVVSAFADKFLSTDMYGSMDDTSKRTLLGMGLTRRAKGAFHGVPEDKTIYRSKHGSVREDANRLFFYAKNGTLLGNAYIGAANSAHVSGRGTQRVYKITQSSLKVFGRETKQQVFQLISELTAQTGMYVRVDQFDYNEGHREVNDFGFVQRANRLVPLSDVVFSVKIPGGFTAKSTISQHSASRTLELAKGKRSILHASINIDTDRVESLTTADRHSKKPTLALADYSVQLAAMLNLAKVSVKVSDMPGWFLQQRRGKIYPQTNAKMIELYRTKRLPLGHDLYFLLHGDKRTFGRIDYMTGPDKRWGGSPVVRVNWADEGEFGQTELSYHMERHLPKGITRATVIQAAARFMRFFHDQIEPFLSKQVIGAGQVTTDDD